MKKVDNKSKQVAGGYEEKVIFAIVEDAPEENATASDEEAEVVGFGGNVADGDSYLWDSVRKVSNLDDHILFVADLINKYEWDVDEEKKLRRSLLLINQKQNDECVNISVIGEFSSGKSSFINAILHDEILVSSILQGTTVVNSVIQYSPSLYVTTVFNNGKTQTFKSESKDAIREKISELSTNNGVGKDISRLVIGVPSPYLKDNKVRIIDTPGTNSTESWHEETTKRALREMSDLSIVLTDATKMLPETLLDFMEENLSDIYGQCAIAATRIDCVKKQEREDVITYAKKKLSKELDIDDALVLPFAAPAILGEMKGENLIGNEQKEMAELSEQSTRKFFEHTAKERHKAQIKKILALVNDTFTQLTDEMNAKRTGRSKELEMLQKSRQAPLEPFISEQKKEQVTQFGLVNRDIRAKLCNCLEYSKPYLIKRLEDNIHNREFRNIEALKNYLNKGFIEECKTECLAFSNMAGEYYCKQDKAFNGLMTKFRTAFKGQFQKLGILTVEFDIKNITMPASATVTVNDVKEAIDYVGKELGKEDSNFWGGLIGGVLAGAIVGGPIGIGIAIAGTLLGANNGPNVQKVKAKVIDKVDKPLNVLFNKMMSDTLDRFDERSAEMMRGIGSEIDRYLDRYKREIDGRIAANKRKSNAVQRQIDDINNDLNLINVHKQQLQNAKKIFNKM